MLTMSSLTKWMMPAAVNQTEMKMEMSWASLTLREASLDIDIDIERIIT